MDSAFFGAVDTGVPGTEVVRGGKLVVLTKLIVALEWDRWRLSPPAWLP